MVDNVQIIVKGGRGGDGLVSFRKEKFVPFGGPDGGDGGVGGNVFVLSDDYVADLKQYKGRPLWIAEKGQKGGGQKKRGKNGEDLWITVPVGTRLFRSQGQELVLLADLVKAGEKVLVARGGRGGWGNCHFATPTNQVPRAANPGELGEEVKLVMMLRMVCDIVIVGYPNVGKSALLSAFSTAHPKVADYPFTTTKPELASLEVGFKRYVVAEMPALVAGASLGRGLGNEFLRHAERARLVLHILDGLSSSPLQAMATVNQELTLFQPLLGQKPQLLVVNKIDLPQVRSRLAALKRELGSLGKPLFFVSATTGEGVPELEAKAVEMVESAKAEPTPVSDGEMRVFRPKPRGRAKEARQS